jgi:hypothetical protein
MDYAVDPRDQQVTCQWLSDWLVVTADNLRVPDFSTHQVYMTLGSKADLCTSVGSGFMIGNSDNHRFYIDDQIGRR